MRLATFLLLLPLTAAQTDKGQTARSADSRAVVVGPDDTVTILALNADEISRAWRVGSSGDLNLPMLGRIRAAGMTVEQLESEIAGRLKRYVKDPQVTVFISEFRSQPVTVTGAVEKPGTLQLQGTASLIDVVMMAGGPKDAGPVLTVTRAKSNGTIDYPGAHEDESGQYSVAELDLKEVMDGRGPAATLRIQPFDVINLPEGKQQRMVHITGEVNRPGAVELVSQDAVSLLKVVAVAGGLTRTAGASKTMIMHVNQQGQQTSTAYIDLGKIMSGKAKDLELISGDIVVVPSSQLKSYLQMGTQSALTTGIYVLARF